MADIRENMIAYRKHRLEEIAKISDFKYVDLTVEQENQLFKSIYNMSLDRQNLLIFKNYYNHSFDELEDIFDIENAKGEYINLLCVLSEILDLDNKVISDASMKKVCRRVAEKINEEINKEFEIKYEGNSKGRSRYKFINSINRRVASIVLIVLIGSSMLVGVNAYANGKIFEWIVNTFEKYTSYNITEENTVNNDDVSITIGYIPKGFELYKQTNKDSLDMYYYKKGQNNLIIKFLYNSINSALNTENVGQEKIIVGDMQVITWKKDNYNYFVFVKNKIACQIYGNINKTEFIEIYNNISISEK